MSSHSTRLVAPSGVIVLSGHSSCDVVDGQYKHAGHTLLSNALSEVSAGQKYRPELLNTRLARVLAFCDSSWFIFASSVSIQPRVRMAAVAANSPNIPCRRDSARS